MNVYRKGGLQEEAAPSSGVVRFCDSTVFNFDIGNCYVRILIDRFQNKIQLYSSLKLSLEKNNIKF